MTRPCRETEVWLGQERTALSEAQRLALEQHLVECADCRALHVTSRGVGELLRAAPGELSPAARERAIAGAFAAPRVARATGTPWRTRTLALAAVAAALLLGFLGIRRAPPEMAWIEGAGVHTFAHASVTLDAEARVRFDSARATLELERGALEVEVDPRPHAPFTVRTASFRALVLGTSFHVDAERVVVRHGHVRVLRGETQLADLHAGERYQREAPVVARAPKTEAEPNTEPEPNIEAEPAPEPKPAKVSRTRANKPPAPEAPSALLAKARDALARDALEDTRRLLQQAEAAARHARDRSEAGTLRAELALRERRPEAAIAAYLAVATDYPGLASGENALFAAAQLSAPGAARPLLERYLTRYPDGRFAAQVRARLKAGTR
ncbi:MAG: FecR domain-containing protein [Polyangiales bacterium]